MTGFSLKDELTIVSTTREDYNRMDIFNRLNTKLPPVKYIYAIKPKYLFDGSYNKKTDFPAAQHVETIGVIVYSMPLRDLKTRTTATRAYFKRPSTLSEQMKLLNRECLYVSRLIIDPRYAGQGLATWLWSETLKEQTVPMVESFSFIPVPQKWLEKLGFRVFLNPAPTSIRRLRKALKKAHITGSLLDIPKAAQERIDKLCSSDYVKLDRSLHHFLSNYKTHEHDQNSIERTLYILSKLSYPNRYLLWLIPHIKYKPVRNWFDNQHTTIDPNIGFVPS